MAVILSLQAADLTQTNIKYLIVELAVHRLPLSVDQFESVRSVSVHMTVAIWNPPIAEEERHLHIHVN